MAREHDRTSHGSPPLPWRNPLPVAMLRRADGAAFDLAPDGDERAAIATFLGVAALPELRFKGRLVADGPEGWRIEGRLTARLEQSCVVTLEPVEQAVDETVARAFVPAADLQDTPDLDPEGEDDPDPFTDVIDPALLGLEILALAIDPYPRAPGAALGESRFAPPGTDGLDDAALKPFAKLAALRDKLAGE